MFPLFIKTFFVFFGVIDPVGNTPIFLTLTEKMDPAARKRIGRRGILQAGLILVVFLALGSLLLDAFHISLRSFRIAGGLVLAWVGFQILFGKVADMNGAEDGHDMSVVPIATPLLAGPGAIATTIILAREYGYLATLAGIAANLFLTFILFEQATFVLKLIGRRGAMIAAKFIGLLLLAMGVDFILNAF
jgi:multiple antibiotic resistance protein